MSATNGVAPNVFPNSMFARTSGLRQSADQLLSDDAGADQTAASGSSSFSAILGTVTGQGQGGSTPSSGSESVGKSVGASLPSSSRRPTLQQIANEFDLHHLTSQQEDQLQGQLVESGALSEKDGLRMFTMTTLANWFDAQHYRIIDGQIVATTPTQQGGLIGDTPGGPTYDVIEQMRQASAADKSFGDTANESKDQTIVNVLDELTKLRANGAAT